MPWRVIAVVLAGAAALASAAESDQPIAIFGLQELRMIDAQTGWALSSSLSSDSLLRTRDGGKTWQPVALPGLTQRHPLDGSLAFPDERHGCICVGAREGARIYFTADAGEHWSESNFHNDFIETLDLEFVDAMRGFGPAFDGSYSKTLKGVYATGDGGRTWQLISKAGLFDARSLPSLREAEGEGFSSPTVGWVAGIALFHHYDVLLPTVEKKQSLYRTTDGGKTWDSQTFAYMPDSMGAFLNYTRFFFFGEARQNGISCLHLEERHPGKDRCIFFGTQDGGENWSRKGSIVEDGNSGDVAIDFLDADRGWAIIGEHWFRTTDGGAAWTRLRGGPKLHAETAVKDLQFIDPKHGWALIENSARDFPPCGIAETNDGGETWHTIYGKILLKEE